MLSSQPPPVGRKLIKSIGKSSGEGNGKGNEGFWEEISLPPLHLIFNIKYNGELRTRLSQGLLSLF